MTLTSRAIAGGQIGGYGGGDPKDPVFRELIVRWFQYGMTCPLFRQHGSRPTEIWLLGNASSRGRHRHSTLALAAID
jgi:alpha-glucosidase (family GH31 glycosyl hydrolase)